jgi:DNA segregation ATPase FtsK/SpoIIIE, S-DNA-T family
MSMIDRSIDGMAFLSGQLSAILRRRLRELGGIALLSIAMMAALALATWSVHDPSLSHATDARVHNLLGRSGAIAADLMMQLLGLGSLALLLPIGIWGYRLLGHRPLSRERLRILLWVFGAVLAATFAACLPRGTHWPLPCGLGGVVGDAMLRAPAVFFGAPIAGLFRLVIGAVLGVATLVIFAGAAGLLWRGSADEEEEVEEEDEADAEDEAEDNAGGWLSLGGLMHTVLSFRTRLALMFRGRVRPPAARHDGAAHRRRN